MPDRILRLHLGTAVVVEAATQQKARARRGRVPSLPWCLVVERLHSCLRVSLGGLGALGAAVHMLQLRYWPAGAAFAILSSSGPDY